MSREVLRAFFQNLRKQSRVRLKYLLESQHHRPQKAICTCSDCLNLLGPSWVRNSIASLLQCTYCAKVALGGDVEHPYENALQNSELFMWS